MKKILLIGFGLLIIIGIFIQANTTAELKKEFSRVHNYHDLIYDKLEYVTNDIEDLQNYMYSLGDRINNIERECY